jgi:hypothetical protein
VAQNTATLTNKLAQGCKCKRTVGHWEVTPYGLADFIDVSEENASSIFRVKEDWRWKIWGYHNDGYQEHYLLDATLCTLVEVIATFRSNVLSPTFDRTVSQGSKACIVLLVDTEDGGSSSETSRKTISLHSVTSRKCSALFGTSQECQMRTYKYDGPVCLGHSYFPTAEL